MQVPLIMGVICKLCLCSSAPTSAKWKTGPPTSWRQGQRASRDWEKLSVVVQPYRLGGKGKVHASLGHIVRPCLTTGGTRMRSSHVVVNVEQPVGSMVTSVLDCQVIFFFACLCVVCVCMCVCRYICVHVWRPEDAVMHPS